MYTDSAIDYEKYLRFYPQNWAGVNDYAWVLMKANRPREAEAVTARELPFYPTNPWLLNSNATALYEMGRTKDAYAQILKARDALSTITREKWLIAYPGNDPAVAEQGIASFKKSVEDNIHSMGASTTVPIVK
jgi:tetratricopeptide (TPR) repeat protein